MITTIARKEIKIQFASPLAWIVLALLQLILAWLFLGRLDAFLAIHAQLMQLPSPPGITEIIVAPLFGSAGVVLLMVTPLLAMRLIAEERRNQTLPFLVSAPLSMTSLILGKFFGALAIFVLVTLLALLMALSLLAGGALDHGLLLTNLLGLILLGASFAAVGLYVSSLTSNPAIAAIGTLGALLALWLVNVNADDPENWRNLLSLFKHFESFNRGLIDSYDLAYYLLFIVVFLALAIRRLDRDRLG
jgi:ABC-2 type transport system permease protein